MSAAVARPVLADVVPGARARDAALVLGAVVVTAVLAQLVVPVPGSPVPITGTTLGVLLSGAALGPVRGGVAQLAYLVLGGLGLPVFAEASGGWSVVAGATGGYILGFVLAGALVGALARRGWDRRLMGTVVAFTAGTAVIYLLGASWLAFRLDVTAGEAIALGVTPYLLGDLLKALLAGLLLPATWRLVGEHRGTRKDSL